MMPEYEVYKDVVYKWKQIRDMKLMQTKETLEKKLLTTRKDQKSNIESELAVIDGKMSNVTLAETFHHLKLTDKDTLLPKIMTLLELAILALVVSNN